MNNRHSKSKRHGLSADIINTLKDRILRWEYLPGHRFTEMELCKEFNVSRGPVREALRVLATEGVLESIPRRGFRVPIHDVSEIQDLYEVRIALELYVVEMVTKKNLPSHILEDLARPWRGAALGSSKTEDELARMDRGFHESLCQYTDNQVLLSYLSEINDRLHLYRIIDFSNPALLSQTCDEHVQIIDAIIAGDVVLARDCVRKNILRALNNVEDATKNLLMKRHSKMKQLLHNF
ncbi:MAG: GntR family transcriptional regulator [Gammaproteobacteria bacterium]